MSRNRAEAAVGAAHGPEARRLARRVTGLLVAIFIASIPAGTGAAQLRAPAIDAFIDVSTRDCNVVEVHYEIDWEGLSADGLGSSTVELMTSPDSFFLTSTALDLGRKEGHWKGKIRGELVRESGYFDARTYPGLSYQLVIVYNNAEVVARSNVVAIPNCVPMSPTSGPASGGTLVTVFGGGTFGGALFTMDSLVVLDGTTLINPIEVAADGTWLRFVAPAGTAGSCMTVWTEPGLPFSLPSYCYDA